MHTHTHSHARARTHHTGAHEHYIIIYVVGQTNTYNKVFIATSAGQYTGNTGIPRYEINTGSIIEIPKYRNSS